MPACLPPYMLKHRGTSAVVAGVSGAQRGSAASRNGPATQGAEPLVLLAQPPVLRTLSDAEWLKDMSNAAQAATLSDLSTSLCRWRDEPARMSGQATLAQISVTT